MKIVFNDIHKDDNSKVGWIRTGGAGISESVFGMQHSGAFQYQRRHVRATALSEQFRLGDFAKCPKTSFELQPSLANQTMPFDFGDI